MKETLSDIVEDYNSNNWCADNKFVNRICISYINEHKLNKYLKSVTTNENGNSNYNPITKRLFVDLDDGVMPAIRILTGDKYLYFDNLLKLRMVLHELEHVNQEKILEDRKEDTEYELVKLNNYHYIYPSFMKKSDAGIIDTIKGTIKLYKYGRYYYKNHDIAPVERLANIKSYNETYNIFKGLDKEKLGRAYDEFRYFSYQELDYFLKCGYKLNGDKTNSPSVDYLSGIKDLKYIVNEYDFDEASKNLSFEERVLYGLSLSKEEYDNIEKLNPYTKVIKR